MDDSDFDASPEGLYPMRVVARLSGLPADTIRAWEKRYGVVRPSRTDGRARRYSEAEVRRLSLLREATERGHSIGSIGRLPDDALSELAKRDPVAVRPREDAGDPYANDARAYLDLIERYEMRKALDAITRMSAILDPRTFCLRFLEPMLTEIGLRWEHGEATVIHEHLVSTHVKMVLGVYTRLGNPEFGSARVAFLTPQGHLHEFGIHIGAILATMRGIEPMVLGADVPHALLDGFVRDAAPDAIAFGVSRDMSDDELAAFRDTVATLAKRTRVLVGCSRTNAIYDSVPGAEFVPDFETLDALLAVLASATREALPFPDTSRPPG